MSLYQPIRYEPDVPMCTSGKRPFRTREHAQAQLRSIAWSRRNNPENKRTRRTEAEAYQCRCCGWWHLASHTSSGRRSDYVYKCRRSGTR